MPLLALRAPITACSASGRPTHDRVDCGRITRATPIRSASSKSPNRGEQAMGFTHGISKFRCLVCILSFVLVSHLKGGASGEENLTAEDAAASFSTSPHECVLLLGDRTVARTSGLTQQFFPAEKHPANPVMRRTEAWEGVGPY